MPRQPEYVYLVVDVYSHALMGVYPDEQTAWLATDNTPAYCTVYKQRVTKLEREAS